MKIFFVALITIGSLNAFAGGDTSPPCLPTDATEVLLTEGKVLDRGGNEVSYRIVMEARRCQSRAGTKTMKYLFLHYDAPIQRSENDGLLLGDMFDYSGTAINIFHSFSLRVSDDIVTKEGLKLQLGGMTDNSTLPLSSIPKGFIGGKGTFVTVFGNAFPTHTIEGPFSKYKALKY